jgi:hypothetical protein
MTQIFAPAPQASPGAGTIGLEGPLTNTASYSGVPANIVGGFKALVVTLDITVADRADANETYDFYITTSDGVSSWDIIHFPQVATSGAKRYTARVNLNAIPQTVASGGAATNDDILRTDSSGSQKIKTLAAGAVRHGGIGQSISHELVAAGTTPSITYSLTATLE